MDVHFSANSQVWNMSWWWENPLHFGTLGLLFHTTLPIFTLIILLVEILKFSYIYIYSKKCFVKEIKESFGISYFQCGIFKIKLIIQKTCVEATHVLW
jgi:hypothetical protein